MKSPEARCARLGYCEWGYAHHCGLFVSDVVHAGHSEKEHPGGDDSCHAFVPTPKSERGT
jgi:hypothetical protein